MKRVAKRIKGILAALMYVVLYYVTSMIVYSAYYLFKLSEGRVTPAEIERNANNSAFALSVITSIICLWLFMLIGRIRKKPLEENIQNRKVPTIIYVMSGCLALGCRLLVSVYYSVSQNIQVLSNSIEQAGMFSPDITGNVQLIIAVFCVIVVAPLFEEFLFRGMVMGELMCIMRPWAAITLQAVIFGLAHGVLFQSIFAAVIGVFLGVVYYRTKSLAASTVCHSVFNISASFMQESMTVTGGLIYITAGILLIALSMIYIYSNSR